MTTKTSIIKKLAIIIVSIAIIVTIVAKLKSNKKIAQANVYQFNKEQSINIQVDTLKTTNIDNVFSYTGTFEPCKETKISAELQGKINTIYVDAGSIVNKGQILIQLDNSLLKLQLQAIEVQIEGLEADVNRYAILDKAEAIQGIQLEKALLGLKSAKIQRASIIEQIKKSTIKSPFTGIVTAKLSEEGAFAAPGVPLIQITDISKLKFTINVPEKTLHQFKTNQNYLLTADAYIDIPISSKAIMIGSKANAGNSFPVQFTIKNTIDLKIKSGMFGKVTFKREMKESGLLVPASALQGTEKQPQVFIVKNGRAHLQNFTISQKFENKVQVSKGLNEGDIIVTNGFINLFDGANVTVK
jgi:RND family efflux transporter MFP subunit